MEPYITVKKTSFTIIMMLSFFSCAENISTPENVHNPLQADAPIGLATGVVIHNTSEAYQTLGSLSDGVITIPANIERFVVEINNMAPSFEGEQDYQKAWRFVVKNRRHFYPLEGSKWAHHPLLQLNSSGFGFCDDTAATLMKIWRAMGYKARQWGISGHVISEVYAEDKWQMFDADLETYYYLRDGVTIASVEELSDSPDLITAPVNPIRDIIPDESGDWYYYGANLAAYYGSVDNNRVSAFYDFTPTIPENGITIPPQSVVRIGRGFVSPRATKLHSRYLKPTEKLHIQIEVLAGQNNISVHVPLFLDFVEKDATSLVNFPNLESNFVKSSTAEEINTYLEQSDEGLTGARIEKISVSSGDNSVILNFLLNKTRYEHLNWTQLKTSIESDYAGILEVHLYPE